MQWHHCELHNQRQHFRDGEQQNRRIQSSNILNHHNIPRLVWERKIKFAHVEVTVFGLVRVA